MMKRFFSSTPIAAKLKAHVPRTTTPTRPNVYSKLAQTLESGAEVHPMLPVDAHDALAVAREQQQQQLNQYASKAVRFDAQLKLEKELGVEKKNPHTRFLARLAHEGGSQIAVFRTNVLHTEFTRFVPLLSDIRGLKLNDAFNQLKWHRKRISRKVIDALEKAVVKAKDEGGLDLNRTYVADAFIKPNGAILSQQFTKRFLRGRGRYGSTPQALTGLLEITLQQRDVPFSRRLADPLEWVRQRLRDRVATGAIVDVESEVYSKVTARRVVKVVHS